MPMNQTSGEKLIWEVMVAMVLHDRGAIKDTFHLEIKYVFI